MKPTKQTALKIIELLRSIKEEDATELRRVAERIHDADWSRDDKPVESGAK